VDRRQLELIEQPRWEQEQHWLSEDPAYDMFLAELELKNEDLANDGFQVSEEGRR
jgi:hypothetical protein